MQREKTSLSLFPDFYWVIVCQNTTFTGERQVLQEDKFTHERRRERTRERTRERRRERTRELSHTGIVKICDLYQWWVFFVLVQLSVNW
jgi:hypothetical protein